MAYNPAEYGDRWARTYDEDHDLVDPAAAVDFLSRRAGDGEVLELGIGTGRIALPLAQRGVRVTGIDSSPAMIERLRQKPGGEDLQVSVGDMATFDLGGPYELVFVAFNTIYCLLDQQRQVACFRNVRKSVSASGRFVVECFVPDVARFRDGNQAVRVLPHSSGHLRLNASRHFPQDSESTYKEASSRARALM